METEKSIDKKIYRVLDKIDSLYVELEELEVKKKNYKADRIKANIKIGGYFSESDGISYSSYFKITSVDAKSGYIEATVVTSDDSGAYSITPYKRVSSNLSQIIPKERFDAEIIKALEYLNSKFKS